MAVRKTIPNKEGLYFITITCARWLSLFEISNGYHIVYNWLETLIKDGHFVCGYVIMLTISTPLSDFAEVVSQLIVL